MLKRADYYLVGVTLTTLGVLIFLFGGSIGYYCLGLRCQGSVSPIQSVVGSVGAIVAIIGISLILLGRKKRDIKNLSGSGPL